MAIFKVKSSKHNWGGDEGEEITYVRPTSTTDEAWKALVGNVAAINELALKAWVIEAQRVARDGKTPRDAQVKVDGWSYKGDAAPTIMNLLGMKVEQVKLDLLRAENPGMEFTNFEIIED